MLPCLLRACIILNPLLFSFFTHKLFKLFTYLLIYCVCVSMWRSEDILVGSLFPPCQSWGWNSSHWAWFQVPLAAKPSCQPFLYGLLGWFVHVPQSNGKNGHRNCGEDQPLRELLCKGRYQDCWWQLFFHIWSMPNTSFLICILLGSHLRQSVVKPWTLNNHFYHTHDVWGHAGLLVKVENEVEPAISFHKHFYI